MIGNALHALLGPAWRKKAMYARWCHDRHGRRREQTESRLHRTLMVQH